MHHFVVCGLHNKTGTTVYVSVTKAAQVSHVELNSNEKSVSAETKVSQSPFREVEIQGIINTFVASPVTNA